MNGPSAGSSAPRNRAACRVVVGARAVVVGKAEAVPVVMAVKVADAQVVREVRVVVADVRVASAALRRVQHPGNQPRCPNKTPLLTAHGGCGSG